MSWKVNCFLSILGILFAIKFYPPNNTFIRKLFGSKLIPTILAQCSISIPPENVRKPPTFLWSIELEH